MELWYPLDKLREHTPWTSPSVGSVVRTAGPPGHRFGDGNKNKKLKESLLPFTSKMGVQNSWFTSY